MVKLSWTEFEKEKFGNINVRTVEPENQKPGFGMPYSTEMYSSGELKLNEVTEARKAQKTIKLLAQAVEAAGEAISILDPFGNFIYVNPAFTSLTGWSSEECIGRAFGALMASTEDGHVYEKIQKQLERETSWSGRLVNRKKDGTVYTADCTVSKVTDEAGRIRNYVIVEKDVSKELEIESQLLHSQKMEFVGRLTNAVAHDFNNLLTAIIGNAKLLLMDTPDDSPAKAELEEILKASTSAAGFINQLLTFSRRSRGEARSINVNHIISEIEPIVRKIVGKEIEIVIKKDPNLKNNFADQGKIEQIIINLAANARDAAPEGGKLLIETKNVTISNEDTCFYHDLDPGDFTAIIVSDNGIGMSGQVKDKIFEPFFTTKEKGKGTGLGLSTVYSIVKQYQGDIRVESSPGEGSTFTILLPAQKEEVSLSHEEDAVIDIIGGSETIMLVEGDESVRGYAKKVLDKLGYKVYAVPDCYDAEQLFFDKCDKIDLIIVDYSLPEYSGRQLVETFYNFIIPRQKHSFQVIFLYDYPEQLSEFSDRKLSGMNLLKKPFSPTELAQKTREALDKGTVQGHPPQWLSSRRVEENA